jgi:AcrR family transcriptional regulator
MNAKRHYLSSDDRRLDLLEAAARVLSREGLPGLTMVAVAAEAGVSRPLLYQHFTDLEVLYDALFRYLSDEYATAIDAIHAAAGPVPGAAVIGAFRYSIRLPPGDLAAIAELARGARPELRGARDMFRARLISRWLPLFRDLDADRGEVRAALWTLVGAITDLAQMVQQQTITEDEGISVVMSLVAGVARGLVAKPQ